MWWSDKTHVPWCEAEKDPTLTFLQHCQTKHKEDPLEESNPSSLWRKSQELVFRSCCPVGLLLKAASVRAGIVTPMELSHLQKTCCVTPHGPPNQSVGLVPQHSFCFLPGSCHEVGLNGDIYCSRGQGWTPSGLWCWDIPTLWVKHRELIKLNPSEAEITGRISAGVNQCGSAGVNGPNPACASTGSGLVPAIVHSHKHCWVPWN